jgi:hypothetical protein
MKTAKRKKVGESVERTLIQVEDDAKFMMKAHVIQLYPTSKESHILNDWIASNRKVWNCGVHAIYTNLKNDPTYKPSEIALRDAYVIAKRMTDKTKKELGWTLRTPKRIREGAIKDLVSGYKGCETRRLKKQIKAFHMKPKDKTDTKQTILISSDSSYIRKGRLVTNGLSMRMREKMEDCALEHNMRLVRIKGLYFICIPISTSISGIERVCQTERIVSVDPGINIFGTYYSPSGEWGEIGLDLKERLKRFYNIENAITQSTRMTPQRKLKALQKIALRIIGMVDDFHWKLAYWYLDNFKTILIPRLYVATCSAELKRLQKDFRHCQFVDRLIHVSRFYRDSRIYVVSERNSTRSCTGCLSMNTTRKDGLVICHNKKCGLITHRDYGASRNVFLIQLR